MQWSLEKSEQFHRRLEQGKDVIVNSQDWKTLRHWHREMMRHIPNQELGLQAQQIAPNRPSRASAETCR
jgi:hypothetical protein